MKTKRVGSVVAFLAALFLLILAGMTYRILASYRKDIVGTRINLPIPLSDFPTEIGNWMGKDQPIEATTKEYMEKNFADDYFTRRYMNSAASTWANVYVVYCSSNPAGILGHNPLICRRAHGWIHDNTEPSQFVTRAGRKIDCLVHRFHKSVPLYKKAVDLNFYILNGQLTADENDFSGPWGRSPNIAGDPARYVAQVQISCVLESSIRTAAKDMTELILDFLPDKDGKVKALEYMKPALKAGR